jgi:hypothetical protein
VVDEDELEICTTCCLQLVGCVLVVQAYKDLQEHAGTGISGTSDELEEAVVLDWSRWFWRERERGGEVQC